MVRPSLSSPLILVCYSFNTHEFIKYMEVALHRPWLIGVMSSPLSVRGRKTMAEHTCMKRSPIFEMFVANADYL